MTVMDGPMRGYLAACAEVPGLDLDLQACARVWRAAMSLPGVADVRAPRWLHSDLLAENLLVRDGRLAAVLDFGALSIGDPTVDLIVAWEVLGADARAVFRAAVDVDDATWLRGRAWCAARRTMARAVLADAASNP